MVSLPASFAIVAGRLPGNVVGIGHWNKVMNREKEVWRGRSIVISWRCGNERRGILRK